MKIILQEKVSNLGGIGDVVDVKPGFARNFLLPRGKAARATADNIALVAAKRAELEQAAAELLSDARDRAEALSKIVVTMPANAGDEGKLFGSVTNRDVAEAICAMGHTVHKKEVHLSDGPIRNLGDYDVVLHLHSEVTSTVKVSVVSDQQEA